MTHFFKKGFFIKSGFSILLAILSGWGFWVTKNSGVHLPPVLSSLWLQVQIWFIVTCDTHCVPVPIWSYLMSGMFNPNFDQFKVSVSILVKYNLTVLDWTLKSSRNLNGWTIKYIRSYLRLDTCVK